MTHWVNIFNSSSAYVYIEHALDTKTLKKNVNVSHSENK